MRYPIANFDIPNTSGRIVRARIYAGINPIAGSLVFRVLIVENGNMRTVYSAFSIDEARRWMQSNGYTEAHAPYYPREVAAEIARGTFDRRQPIYPDFPGVL